MALMRWTMILALGLGSAGAQAGEWQSLFDGKTLTGWHVAAKPEDRGKVFWQVRDGAMTADSLGRPEHDYVWLVSDGEFGDFELDPPGPGLPALARQLRRAVPQPLRRDRGVARRTPGGRSPPDTLAHGADLRRDAGDEALDLPVTRGLEDRAVPGAEGMEVALRRRGRRLERGPHHRPGHEGDDGRQRDHDHRLRRGGHPGRRGPPHARRGAEGPLRPPAPHETTSC